MKALLVKELKLAMHPTVPLFWLLSAMLLIPSYPYLVCFFYTALGVFFVCLGGRENHDIEYSLTLPIEKGAVVSSRMLFAVLIELTQLLLAVPCALIRQGYPAEILQNDVGMDANAALFGLAFLMLGLFNLSFFPGYYKNPDKVGKSFALSSISVFVFIVLEEAFCHFVPLFQNVLDTPGWAHPGPKLALLGIGFIGYALMTLLAWRLSKKRFAALDL